MVDYFLFPRLIFLILKEWQLQLLLFQTWNYLVSRIYAFGAALNAKRLFYATSFVGHTGPVNASNIFRSPFVSYSKAYP